MHIEFTYSRSRKYFRRQLVRTASVTTARPRTIGQLVLLAAVIVLVVTHGNREGVAAGVFLLIGGGALLTATRVRRHRMVTVPGSWLRERRWLLTDDRLESATAYTLARHSWSQLRLLRIFRDSYVLGGADGRLVDIPREPLSAADDAQLRTLLDRLPLGDVAPLPAEPPAGEGTRIEFTSSQPAQPIGTRRAALRRSRIRRAAVVPAVAGIVLLAAGLTAGVVVNSEVPALLGAFAAVTSLIALARLVPVALRRSRDPAGTPRRYAVTDQALQVDGAGMSIRWSWPVVKRLEEWPETYVLYADGGFPFTVPRDTLTPTQEDELRARLHEHGWLADPS